MYASTSAVSVRAQPLAGTRRPAASVASRAQRLVVRALDAPAGYRSYESMVILRPDLQEEDRDAQLAKIESSLSEQGAVNVEVDMKGVQRMAYPITGFWEGFMFFMKYDASPEGIKKFETAMATPDVESQGKVLRWNILKC